MKKKTLALLCAGAMFATPMMASAYEAGDMLLRFGAATVDPEGQGDKDDGEVWVGDDTQLGVNFTYMFTDNVGVEVLAATPFTHDVYIKGVGKVGEAEHLPPTVTAQWYFNNESNFTPYLGAGFNYTIFLDSNLDAAGLGDMDLKNSFGLALEAGFDYSITDNWGINAAIWMIDIETEVENGPAKGTEVIIDPFVYMLSAVYKF